MADTPSSSQPSSSEDRLVTTEPSSEDLTKSGSFDGNAVVPKDGARAIVGEGMTKFSELINDNIIAARYGTFATIALLTAYGISRTPLLFRYRNVAEIPRSDFVGRRHLYCRIIGVHRDTKVNYSSKGNENAVIHVSVRHLSPIGALLPTSWFESLMRISPSNSNFSGGLARGENAQKANRELLRLQIAGIVSPPLSRDYYDPEAFLESLAKKRTLVSCQLLGRRIVAPREHKEDSDYRKRNQLPSGSEEDTTTSSADLEDCQVALSRLTYRPGWQIFPTDIAEALVREGNANAASTVLNHCPSDDDLKGAVVTKITDTSQRIQDIRRDVKYLDRLETCEFEAAQKSIGMWSVPEVRQIKKEIVDEVDFQAKANPLQKLWRMIRGG